MKALNGESVITDLNASARVRRSPLPEYVAGGKGGPWYTAHTYPTKIPPETITPFIEASTHEGGLVVDPFCGSGMTGVAALLTGRQAILSDISPGAVHLANSHTRRVDADQLNEVVALLDAKWMRRYERDLYASSVQTGDDQSISGIARHTIWSEVYGCLSCNAPVVLWDVTAPNAPLARRIQCPACHAGLDRTTLRVIRSIPTQITVSPEDGGKLVHGAPTIEALARIELIGQRRLRYWVPRMPISADREMYIRSALHLRGVRTVADMFTKRPLLALSRLRHEISAVADVPVREALEFAFTNTAWHASRMRRYNARGGQRPLTGTLFIPQLVSEPNVFEVFRNQVRQVVRLYEVLPDGRVDVQMGSATDLHWLPDASVDYVFTDPPFGNNIHYADCNIVWEAWLGETTDNDAEIVVNRSRTTDSGGKTLADYQRLLTASFREARRIVAPGGRVSIVFHNSDDAVWSALLDAVEDAGLHQAEVSLLDKGQRSQKGYKIRQGELVPFYDLVMTFSSASSSPGYLNGIGDLAVDIVVEYLAGMEGQQATAKRRLDYLYSVAVSGIIRAGAKPDGLSLRAFERICETNLNRVGDSFYLLTR